MRGFSLIEVMISLAIAMLLLVAVAQLGVFVEQLWLQQEKTMNRIEALNVVYAWIGRDIESAGYFGCLKQSLRQDWDDPLHLLMPHELELSGSSIALQYMSPQASSLLSKISPDEWVVESTLAFKEGDEIVFQDCQNMAINRITAVSHQGDHLLLQLAAPVVNDFSAGATVGYLQHHEYQIKTTTRKNPKGELITSVYVFNHEEWQELVEAVGTIVWCRSGVNIIMQLTMMDGVLLTMQVEQKNAA